MMANTHHREEATDRGQRKDGSRDVLADEPCQGLLLVPSAVCVCGVCVVVPSELENLERDWEMTVLPHPKAPGTATVPPYKHMGQAEARGARDHGEVDCMNGTARAWAYMRLPSERC